MRVQPLALSLVLAFGALSLHLPAGAQTPSATSVRALTGPVNAVRAQLFTEVEGIAEYRLPNGLRVLLAPDASKPTTTVNITYLVGSRHENYGETGMAHLLEHLLFKGTATRGNIMQELGKRGMQFNGTTFYDRTNYFETFPANDENLKWALEMEADRMVGSRVARDDLVTEFSVVRNEMEAGENSPHRSLWQHMTAAAYDWHNYGKSTIGARTDVENVRIENLQAFYRQYYQPDNAVLLVSGKFESKATLALIERTFGPIPRPRRTLQPTYTQDPVQHGPREVTLRRVGDIQLAAALYHTLPASHPDAVAVAALSEILGATPNGRLHKKLVTPGQAVSVQAWNFELAEPGYILFLAQLNPQQSLAQARQTLLDALENIATEPITEEELQRAKASLLSEFEKTMNDPQQLGVQLSESIAQGDWRLFFLQRDRIEALKLQDVQRVALNHFRESNRTFGQFLPTPNPERMVRTPAPSLAQMVEGYKGRQAVAAGENFDASPANIDARTRRSALPGGLQLALTPKKTRGETVHGQLRLDFGDVDSLKGQSSVSALTAAMLMRGTERRSREELVTRLDQIKSEIAVGGQGSTVTVTFRSTRTHLPEVLQLVREVLRQPAFPVREFELLQRESLNAIDEQRSDPQAMAVRAAARALEAYPAGDVRATRSFDEQAADLRAVRLEDLQAFYKRFYGANHAKLAVVGDFDPEAVTQRVRQDLDGWKSAVPYARLVSQPAPRKPGALQIEAPDKPNAFYIAALPLRLKDDAPEFVPMLLINEVLGGGVKSRLMDRLRQKDGISYGAGSRVRAGSFEDVGSLEMLAIYAPQNLDNLKSAVAEELARFVKDGLTAEELQDARKALQEETRIALAQDPELAARLTAQLHTGRTTAFTAARLEQAQKLTLEEVNAVLRRLIDPAAWLHVYAGDFAGAKAKSGR
ncbi:MAG: M16 family metallopeptidase [Limnohabitans sp.]